MADTAEVKTPEELYKAAEVLKASKPDYLVEDFGAVQGSLASVLEHAEVRDPVGDVHEKAIEKADKVHTRAVNEEMDGTRDGPIAGGDIETGTAAAIAAMQETAHEKKKKEDDDFHRLLRLLERIEWLDSEIAQLDIDIKELEDLIERGNDIFAAKERGEDITDENGELKDKKFEARVKKFEEEYGIKIDRNNLDDLLLVQEGIENKLAVKKEQRGVLAQERSNKRNLVDDLSGEKRNWDDLSKNEKQIAFSEDKQLAEKMAGDNKEEVGLYSLTAADTVEDTPIKAKSAKENFDKVASGKELEIALPDEKLAWNADSDIGSGPAFG